MTPSFTIPEDELRQQATADGITHLSTGIAVVQGGKILVVRREPNDYKGGNFELPGGGVDPGESLFESVKRELLEETSLTLTAILGMFPGFEYTTPHKPHVRQFNFLVSADGEVQLSSEHDKYLWIGSESEIAQLVVSTKMTRCLQDALAVAEDLA